MLSFPKASVSTPLGRIYLLSSEQESKTLGVVWGFNWWFLETIPVTLPFNFTLLATRRRSCTLRIKRPWSLDKFRNLYLS